MSATAERPSGNRPPASQRETVACLTFNSAANAVWLSPRRRRNAMICSGVMELCIRGHCLQNSLGARFIGNNLATAALETNTSSRGSLCARSNGRPVPLSTAPIANDVPEIRKFDCRLCQVHQCPRFRFALHFSDMNIPDGISEVNRVRGLSRRCPYAVRCAVREPSRHTREDCLIDGVSPRPLFRNRQLRISVDGRG